MRWNPHDRISALIRKERSTRVSSLSLSPSCEHTVRQVGMSATPEVGQELNLLALWSLTSQPPELWELNLCCESHPVYGISSWDDWCSAEQRVEGRGLGFATLQPPSLVPREQGWRWRIFSRWKHSSFKIFIYFCTWLCCILAAACRILSCSMTALICGMRDLVPWPGIKLWARCIESAES